MTRRSHILIIAPNMCRGDTASGDLRLQRIIEQLASFAEVDFLTPEVEPEFDPSARRYWSLLRKLGVRIVNPRFTKRLPLWCRSRTRPYDWIFIEFWHLADQLTSILEVVRREFPKTKIAIDSVDLHFLRERAALKRGSNSYGSATEIELREQKEISTYLRADLVIACSQEDAQVLALACARPNIVIPNVIKNHPRRPGPRGYVISFVGGFRHQPNVDAVLWFVHDVYPLIRARLPDAVFRIAGSHTPETVHALCVIPGVEVLGFVDDTTRWLDSAAVSVAPLRYGAGMKGKVTEALSAGLPVVTTSFGAQGLGARSGKHLHIANSAADFASAVVETLADSAKAEQMGLDGQALVEAICGPQVVRKVLMEAFNPILPSTSRRFTGWIWWVSAQGTIFIWLLRNQVVGAARHMKRAKVWKHGAQ